MKPRTRGAIFVELTYRSKRRATLVEERKVGYQVGTWLGIGLRIGLRNRRQLRLNQGHIGRRMEGDNS